MTSYGPSPLLRISVALLLLALFAALAWVVLGLPPDSAGLRPAVTAQMAASGVNHPVTAVLLNFRGYDTLLELAVLLLAGLGVWSLAPAVPPTTEAPGMMLDNLPRRLVPLMVLVAGYLLWRGADGPGGAFQAGAVLGAAGVLLLLAGWRLPARWQGWPLRLLLVSGVAMFVLVGLAVVPWSGLLLAYPLSVAGALILLIEALATLAIGTTLVALFLGGEPGAPQ
ncbi:MAG: MnhB domain-containing protein [Thiohalophilus sp.]|nr:MnhB domain-containing protein [Thiohalophilus sp.]MDZ7662705.1 MnhB domain-containing protein [Thiohalophilus sp.]